MATTTEIALHRFPPTTTHPTAYDSIILVLIHGGALSHRMYRTLIPYFTAQGFHVLAPDLPGHGKSSFLGPFTFPKATDYLSRALQALIRSNHRVVTVGVSLGGQVVLDLLAHYPDIVTAAIVSGVSIDPPSEDAQWEMPHMPTDPQWLSVMMEDVGVMGMENAQGIQEASFKFKFEPAEALLPPVLVVVGEQDVAMAKRDFEHLLQLVQRNERRSRGLIMKGAWHNHPIDVPQVFADVVTEWIKATVLGEKALPGSVLDSLEE
jgi:pimeloyl-ACP methyl ester carboxylesterase